jgi:hypothetical protein
VWLGVVANQVIAQPQIGFGLVLRRVEMVKRLVRFLDRAERPFDLALRARGHAPPIRITRHVHAHIDPQLRHHAAEGGGFRDRAVVQV